jgi:hypothetical protein
MILRKNKLFSSIFERITEEESRSSESTNASEFDRCLTDPIIHNDDTFSELTSSQEKTFTDFVELVREEYLTLGYLPEVVKKECLSNSNLLRFMKARNFKIDAAFEMWRSWVEWRSEFRPDLIRKTDVKHLPLYAYFKVHKQDKDGNPLVVMAPGSCEEELDIEDCKKVCIYLIEKATKKSSKVADGKISVIFDRLNMTQAKDKKWLPIYKMMSQILQDYYPETLKTAFVVNANWFTKIIISMVKTFMAKNTKDKIITIKGMDQLYDHFDHD